MEFKKPNRYDRGQPQRNAPRPVDTTFINRRPVRQSPLVASPTPPAVPPLPQDTPKKTNGVFALLPSREAIISYIRQLRFTKKTIIISAVVIAIIGLLALGLSINRYNTAKEADSSGNPNEVVQELEYQTILPDGKSISELGGWRRVSPSKSDPVFAYTDRIGEASINVSQQPLPKSFIGDTDDEVAELAKKFNATTKIDAGGITVYVGSSAKGPQSAIFTKNSLLILIKSQEKIDDASWSKYIKSLN